MQNNFLTDKQFWVAVIAAIIVWVLAYFFTDGLIAKQAFNPMYAIIIYPILEELAFRGFIQELIGSKIKRDWAYNLSYANIITSVLFVLVHLFYNQSLLVLSVFIPSLIFGYFKDRTGNIMPSIILHIFYNAGFFYLI